MGLDLIVEGCSKPGHEAEWRRALERSFAEEELTDAEVARFNEISIPSFERLDAPRVGHDPAADAWIIEAQGATTPDQIEQVLKDFHGHYAVALVKSDGVPAYSQGGLYDGVDETSFRGSFLGACHQVLPKPMIVEAWNHKLPEAAVAYGEALLAAAEAAAAGDGPPPAKPGFFARMGLRLKPRERVPLNEQLEIVRAAGRWFIFWGERGHAIRAWC